MAVCSQQDTEQKIKTLENNLQSMPIDMRLFSLAMRSLYSDEAVGGNNEVSTKFRKLRDNTRNDAMVYLRGVLPVSTKFVASISDYFEYYGALTYDEWCSMIPDILKEATAYKQLSKTIVTMHEDILVPLKEREDEARVIINEFEGLQKIFYQKSDELGKKADSKREWAVWLALIPGVGTIASHFLAKSAEGVLAEAIANKEEAVIHERAAITVNKTLIPALKNFIAGLEAAAGFFSVMEQELGKFEDKAEKGVEEKKKLHYMVMKKEAEKMDALCKSFFAVLPAVRTDFEAIPSKGTDKSYVDRWLAKQKQTIWSRVAQPKLAESIMKAITQY